MKQKDFIRGILFLLIGLIQSASLVLACDCPALPTPREAAFKPNTAVFAGKVLNIEKTSGIGENKKVNFAYYKVQFAVERAWNGNVGKSDFVTTALDQKSCGFPFVKGTEYLVYAQARKGQKYWSTGICTRTRRLADAKEDLSKLGRGLSHAEAIALAKEYEKTEKPQRIITKSHYRRLRKGMSFDEVWELIPRDPYETTGMEHVSRKVTRRQLKYRNPDGSTLVVHFTNGKLDHKRQSRLK